MNQHIRNMTATLAAFWLSAFYAVAQLPNAAPAPIEFIDTSFENASPLWWDIAGDGVVQVHLNYDHERNSSNRAAGHIHFQLQAKAGARFTLEFRNLENIYNGKPGSVAGELKALVVSEDGGQWRSVATRALPTNRVQLAIEMSGPKLFVARVEPYRLSDLDALLKSNRKHRRVQITEIGRTVEGRPLEIISATCDFIRAGHCSRATFATMCSWAAGQPTS